MATASPPPVSHSQQPPSGGMSLIVVAIVLGLIVVGINSWYVNKVRKEAEGDNVWCYKMVRSFEAGHELKVTKDVIKFAVPREIAEKMGLLDQDQIELFKGKPFSRDVREGEPLTTNILLEQKGALDHKVISGKRATPIPLASRSAPGLLRPGMRIDILATVPGEPTKTIVAMEDVKVLAVGSDTNEASTTRRSSFSTITIEITPDESKVLIAASRYVVKDGFDVTIRNPQDHGMTLDGTINPILVELLQMKL